MRYFLGNIKVKPLIIYNSLNPRVLKSFDKENNFFYSSNKTAWLTQINLIIF